MELHVEDIDNIVLGEGAEYKKNMTIDHKVEMNCLFF